jgi:hypothetical protein
MDVTKLPGAADTQAPTIPHGEPGFARRQLTDPDYSMEVFDDDAEHPS